MSPLEERMLSEVSVHKIHWISTLADPGESTRDLPRDIVGELDLPENLSVPEVRFSSRGDEWDLLPRGGWLHGTAQKSTPRSGICGLRVSNSQLGAMPGVASVSLSVDDHFKGNPSTILGPRREISHLYLYRYGRGPYAEWIDPIRRSSETLQELGMFLDLLCRDVAEAIGACTKLRRLQLLPSSYFSEYSQLEAILRDASNLEYFEIDPKGGLFASGECLREVVTMPTLQYLQIRTERQCDTRLSKPEEPGRVIFENYPPHIGFGVLRYNLWGF